MTKGAEFLAPFPAPGEEIELEGQKFEIRPIVIGQVAPMARAMEPLRAELEGLKGFEDLEVWKLAGKFPEPLIDTVSVASGRPREVIAALELDAFIKLAALAIKTNADFFSEKVGPALAEAMRDLAGLTTEASGRTPGPTRLQSSPAAATDTEK